MKMSFDESRHLAARTGLGVVWEAVERLEGKTKDTATQEILASTAASEPTPPTFHDWAELSKMRRSGGASRQEAGRLIRAERRALQAWMAGHLRASPTPIHERMTLFWHNHLTSSLTKVPPAFMLRQHRLLRHHAIDRFGDLLRAAAFDPAMLIYLDGIQNRRGRLNENFARELLELFTLGEGYYTEVDVRSAARAFSGWRINYDSGEVYFDRRRHDTGTLDFLGHTGRLSASDIIDVLLEHPRTAYTIAKKLWYWFVSEAEPIEEVVTSWAEAFRHSEYDTRVLLNTILQSDAFWSPKNRGALTKSPIDLVIGGVRELGIDTIEPGVLARWCRDLGQDLLNPPTVAGWKGGSAWINGQTLLQRRQFIRRLIGARELTMTTQASADRLAVPNMPPLNMWESWLLPMSDQDARHAMNHGEHEEYLTALMLDLRYQLR